MAGGIAWKLQRLRSMSPAEVAWRIEQRLALRRLSRRAGRPAPALPRPDGGLRAAFERSSAALVPPGVARGAADFEARHPGETARVVARADAIRSGRLERFARTTSFGPDLARWPWNRDGDDGPEAADGFGPALDYRDPAAVGDARLAWELGRFGFLAPPAQAAWLTGDARHAEFVFAALEAWIAACPPYRGIQWVSALEYALRSLSWGFALALVARTPAGAAIDDERWERVLASWAEQLRFVARHDARFSSANNHRLGEAAGLAWGGLALGFLPEAEAWRARGLAVLEECVLAQTTPDGVTREHAFQYQHFVLDFAVVVEAAAMRTGRAMPGPVRARLAAVTDTLDWFAPGGSVWPVGDGDEGQALPLGEPFDERAAASLEAARALVEVGAAPARHPRAFWLGLDAAPAEASAARPALSGRVVRGGYAVEAWATPWGEARLLFDAAEMGLPPLFAHGHADALMLLLDVAGPRLVDPGTGAYHARPELRDWLRSTAAHNTLELDGRSQSTPGGLFQWLRVARVRDAAADGWAAAHDGYASGSEGARHHRSVERVDERAIQVVDRVDLPAGGGMRRAIVRWHVGDGRAVLLEEAGTSRARVSWPDGFALVLEAALPAGGTAEVKDDATWAPRFLEPRPCGVVEWIVESSDPFEIGTRITLDGTALRPKPGVGPKGG